MASGMPPRPWWRQIIEGKGKGPRYWRVQLSRKWRGVQGRGVSPLSVNIQWAWALMFRVLYGYVYDTEARGVLGTTGWSPSSPVQWSGYSSNDTRSIQFAPRHRGDERRMPTWGRVQAWLFVARLGVSASTGHRSHAIYLIPAFVGVDCRDGQVVSLP